MILIPKLGFRGSAWATFICYFSIAGMSYYIGQLYFHVPYSLKKIAMYFGLAFVFFLIYSFLHEMYDHKAITFFALQSAGTLMFLGYIGWLYIGERKNLSV